MSANVSIGQTDFFVATVTGMNSGVVWEVNGVPGGNSTIGTVDASGAASGLIARYTAPTAIPSPPTVTVSAVSQADPTIKANVSVRIGPLVSVSPVVATVQTFASLQFSASVTGTTNTAVSWQVSCKAGGSACGAISPAGLYKAPNSVPTAAENNLRIPDMPLVTAISQADAGFSGSTSVRVQSLNQQAQSMPIMLGTSGSNADDTCTVNNTVTCSSGTLGALLVRGTRQYILSNSHVLAATGNATLGDPIVQPGLLDTSPSGCNPAATITVANLSEFFDLQAGGNPVDAAIAEAAASAVDSTGTIIGLGDIIVNGVPQPGAPAQGSGAAAVPNRPVAKSGAATGVTCSRVEAVQVSLQVQVPRQCPAASFTMNIPDAIIIAGAHFSAVGDSGSLVVDESTAQPLALLVAGNSTTTFALPIATVLNAFRDASNNVPTVVGGAPHAVAACSLPPPTAASDMQLGQTVRAKAIEAADQVKNRRGYEVLGKSEILAIGVGESLDAPGESAIVVFAKPGARELRVPAELDGIRTRIVELDISATRGLLSDEETRQLLSRAKAVRLEPLPNYLVQWARTVKEEHAARLLADPAIVGVGIGASLDSPTEPALVIYVLQGRASKPIPAVVEGLRTRVKETSGFHAGTSRLGHRTRCLAETAK